MWDDSNPGISRGATSTGGKTRHETQAFITLDLVSAEINLERTSDVGATDNSSGPSSSYSDASRPGLRFSNSNLSRLKIGELHTHPNAAIEPDGTKWAQEPAGNISDSRAATSMGMPYYYINRAGELDMAHPNNSKSINNLSTSTNVFNGSLNLAQHVLETFGKQ